MQTLKIAVSLQWSYPSQAQIVRRDSHQDLLKQHAHLTEDASVRPSDSLIIAPLEPRWTPITPLDDYKLLGNFALLEPKENEILTLVKNYGLLDVNPQNSEVRNQEIYRIEEKPSLIEEVYGWLHLLPYVYVSLNVQYATEHPETHPLRQSDIMERWPGTLREAWVNCNGISNNQFVSNIETRRFHNYLLSIHGLTPTSNFTAVPRQDEDTGYQLQLQPLTLRQAILTQLVIVAAGATGLHHCVQCRTYFTGSGHRDKMYCSNACKQMASRERQKATATTVRQLRPRLAGKSRIA